VHCWCISESSLAQTQAAGEELNWNNCDGTNLQSTNINGVEKGYGTAVAHCSAPLNNNVFALTENGETYNLGGNCRSAVYEVAKGGN
jgi:hypothetical protein